MNPSVTDMCTFDRVRAAVVLIRSTCRYVLVRVGSAQNNRYSSMMNRRFGYLIHHNYCNTDNMKRAYIPGHSSGTCEKEPHTKEAQRDIPVGGY